MRGARLMLPAIKKFNRLSRRFHVVPYYVDPVPGRAESLAAKAIGWRVTAQHQEGRIEEVLLRSTPDSFPSVLHLDRPKAASSAMRAAQRAMRPILAYMLVRTPQEELIGIRIVIGADETAEMQTAAQFFDRLGDLTVRSGATSVVGRGGRVDHRAIEPVYRQWFAHHMGSNLAKLVAGLEPESDPIEVTYDGRTSLPFLIIENNDDWMDPSALAKMVLSEPGTPILRGKDFAVGELGSGGIRIHRVRLRLDGKPALQAQSIIDATTLSEELARERARRRTISRTQPVMTTD